MLPMLPIWPLGFRTITGRAGVENVLPAHVKPATNCRSTGLRISGFGRHGVIAANEHDGVGGDPATVTGEA